MRKHLTMAAAALILGGCASTYQLTLMPRDSGKLYYGVAEGGNTEGRISVTIDNKTYNGSWVQVAPERTSGYVSGGFGGFRRGWGLGGMVTLDNPEGGSSTALMQAPDGSGLRCDLRGGAYGFGGGNCRDDKGRTNDVQLRAQQPSKAPS